MNNVKRELKECKVCGHKWFPRIKTKKIFKCPKCKSFKWNNPNKKNEYLYKIEKKESGINA